jgi:hypothetical protein
MKPLKGQWQSKNCGSINETISKEIRPANARG